MSIRYTLRHNIPSDKLAEEDVNDSSTWDLNLLRKHELAETDNHDIVYRKHDGEVVNWADAATQQANDILDEVQELSDSVSNQAEIVLAQLEEISTEASTLTEQAQEANEAAQTALVQAELAVTESQASADSASWSSTRASEWASKTDGLVGDEDYSSKYYAQQSGASASSASSSASTATSAKNNAQTSAANASNSATLAQQWATKTDGKVDSTDYSAKHYALSCVDSATSASQSATSASNSASTATTKASEASSSASAATTKASEASASATSASNSASTATTKASEASASATSASQSATSASASATDAEDAKDVAEAIAEQIDLVNKLIVYDNIVDMSEDISLQSGQTAQTKGQQTINDGKPSLYTIRDREQSDVDDRYNIVFLDNGKTAERVGSDTSDFLPLSGGTMTGNIHFNKVFPYIGGNLTDGSMSVLAGSNYFDGATLQLFGRSDSTYAGRFYLRASTKSSQSDSSGSEIVLAGRPDGTLTWGGNDIITSSGGTMTGTLTLKSPIVVANQTVTSRRNVTDSWNLLLGGTSDSNGAYLRLDGSTSNMTGSFTLKANDGTNSKTLVGSPSGTLTWGGTSVSLSGHTHPYLPLSGGTMTGEIVRNTYVVKNNTDNSYTEFLGGKDETSSYLVLYGKKHPNAPGRINLRANNGTNNTYLTLEPKGSLTWAGKEVERVNARGSNSNGDYIRYDNGIQICWGGFANVSVPRTITYPAAFNTSSPAIGIDRGTMMCGAWSATGCDITMVSGGTSTGQYLKWIAIGTWK